MKEYKFVCTKCGSFPDKQLCNCGYLAIELGMNLSSQEIKALVQEFSHTFINANENPIAVGVMQRMIRFVDELAKDNS